MNAAMNAAARQAGCFALVGAAAAATHFAALVLLVRAGLAPQWGNVGAFAVAFAVSFAGHYRFTFRQSRADANAGARGRWLASLWRWLASSLCGFALNHALFLAGLRLLGPAAYQAAWLAATALVTLATFALGKFWAFSHETHHPQRG